MTQTSLSNNIIPLPITVTETSSKLSRGKKKSLNSLLSTPPIKGYRHSSALAIAKALYKETNDSPTVKETLKFIYKDELDFPEEEIQGIVSWCEENLSIPQLPDIESFSDLTQNYPDPPETLLDGLIHRGTKVLLGASSKVGKTWLLLKLMICLAHGMKFLGRETKISRVLYINMELMEYFIKERISSIINTMDIQPTENESIMDVWTLRGCTVTIDQIIQRIRDKEYDLIIIDPIYKLATGKNENEAGEMGELMNKFSELAKEINAAVVICHHYSKGNKSKTDSIDRFSGSGVFGRDPDTIITITDHNEEHHFTVDLTTRNFPPQDSFVIKSNFPVIELAEDKDPKDLKDPNAAKLKYSPERIAGLLNAAPLKHTEWKDATLEVYPAMSPTTFNNYVKRLEGRKQVIKREADGKYQIVPGSAFQKASGGISAFFKSETS
jgi:archaellum biogenesis ATPase FlaH